MSAALPEVTRRRAIHRRLAVRRWVIIGILSIFGWVLFSAGLGALSHRRDLCTGCHVMRGYAVSAVDSTHPAVKCSVCHRTSGRLAVITDGIALQRRTVRTLFGNRPWVSAVNYDTCLGCHSKIMTGVTVARTIRVQHSDFIDTPCSDCHGGVGHMLEDHQYSVPEMDRCMGCHTASAAETTGCTMCHSLQGQRIRRETDNTWRVTHGGAWETSHGLGQLDGCQNCHSATKCAGCHGTPIPHLQDWRWVHGNGLTRKARKSSCEQCHESTWCDTCHGLKMPHEASFFESHDERAKQVGEDVCARCHVTAGCEDCHMRANHKKIPGVKMQHGEGR